MSLIKKLAGETAIYGGASILSRLLNFVLIVPVLTYLLAEKKDFGIHGILYTYTALLLVLCFWRLDTALFRFGSKDGQLNIAFSTAAISVIGSTILLVSTLLFFAEDIAIWLSYPDKKQYVQYFAFIIGFDALAAIPFARLRLENKAIRFAIIKIVNVVISISIVLFFLSLCPWLKANGSSWVDNIYDESLQLDYVFIANVAASFIVMLLLMPILLKAKLKFDFDLWKKMLQYAWPLIIVTVAGIINQFSALILQQEFLGGSQDENLDGVAVYNATIKIAVLMTLFATAFNMAAEPFFFNQAKRSDSKLIYAQTAQAFTMVASVALLGILMYMDIIQYMVEETLRSGLYLIPILLTANLFLGLYYNFSIWYKLTDKTIYGAYISVVAAIITLSINYIFLPQIGLEASAWAALACYFFMAMMGYLLGRKYFPVPYKLFNMFGYILLALAIYFISQQIRFRLLPTGEAGSPNMWTMIGINTVLLIGYLGILFGWERKTIRGFLK